MALEIPLIQVIEKTPILYNNLLPEYNRKELWEDAWKQVADQLGLTVNEVKEKWRNIRSSFLRSLKHTNKSKKPYYLQKYLEFLIPFLRRDYSAMIAHTQDENVDFEDQTLPQDYHYDISTAINIKQEHIEIDPNEISQDAEDLVVNIPAVNITSKRSAIKRMRRVPYARYNPDVTRKKIKRARAGKSVPSDDESVKSLDTDIKSMNTNSSDAMKYFLMSLVPELDSMSEEQVRMFKIKVMVLIDDIKTTFEQLKTESKSNDNQRLQKRLINLLLKNLEKNKNAH